MLHDIIGCLVTDVSSNPLCIFFNSDVALGYLGPWKWVKHTPGRCATTYRSYLKKRNISCSAWTLNMKCVGCLETSVRNVQPTLRKTQKSGAPNHTAAKHSICRRSNGHTVAIWTPTQIQQKACWSHSAKFGDTKECAACTVLLHMWEVPPSAVLVPQLFSLTTFEGFLRCSADIPLQYLRLDLLPHSLRFIFH